MIFRDRIYVTIVKGLVRKMEFVKLENRDKIWIMTISRENVLNAINRQMIEEISHGVEVLESDKSAAVLIITGTGRAFAAGADVKLQCCFSEEEAEEWGRYGSSVLRRIELLEFPTIAAVNGYALGGGCELAMSCDMIIADEKAVFGQPESKLGVIPGFSGTQRLPRRVGVSKAKELLFTGRLVDAEEAVSIGLSNMISEHGHVLDDALKLAEEIAENSPMAMKYAKLAVDEGMETDLDSAIELENRIFGKCFDTYDQKEGMGAFLEKRKPVFCKK